MAEAVAAELVESVGLEPGASLRVLAQRLGFPVFEPRISARVRGFCAHEPPALFVVPSGSNRRDEFTLGHGIMQLRLPPALLRSLDEEGRRRVCDFGSSCLLLPREAFLSSVRELRWDLRALLARWPNASFDALARRLVQLNEGVAVARQLGTGWLRRGSLGREIHTTPAVNDAMEALVLGASEVTVEREGVLARAWRLGPDHGDAIGMLFTRAGAVPVAKEAA